MAYNWQLPDWPLFTYDTAEAGGMIIDFAREIGEVDGFLEGLPDVLKQEALVQIMLAEAIKTSEIEGEYMSREDVMSSIRNNLGLSDTPVNIKDRRASGIARLMMEIRKTFRESLTSETLKSWHSLLFSHTGLINAGEWRQGNACK